MARDRRRGTATANREEVRYDHDGTVIIAKPSEEEENPVTTPIVNQRPSRRVAESVNQSTTLPVVDVIDAFASYTSVPRWYKYEKSDKPGVCSICKKPTMCRIRKICGDCMDKYSDLILELAKEAVENGRSTISLDS